MTLGSGNHKAFIRGDGTVHTNERSWSFQRFMEAIIPVAIVLLLGWLLKINSDNGALLATLVERTGNQTQAIVAERADRASADAFLQREIEELQTHH